MLTTTLFVQGQDRVLSASGGSELQDWSVQGVHPWEGVQDRV